MEELPRDIAMSIALNLSAPEVIKFCSVNKKTNREVCDSNDFWFMKLKKDYPTEMVNITEKIKYPKAVYISRFRYVSVLIEKFIERMIDIIFGQYMVQFLNKEYNEELFRNLYQVYLSVNYHYMKAGRTLGDIKVDIFYEHMGNFFPHSVSPEYERVLRPHIIKLIDDFTSSDNKISAILKRKYY